MILRSVYIYTVYIFIFVLNFVHILENMFIFIATLDEDNGILLS